MKASIAMRTEKRAVKNILYPLIGLLAFILIWYLVSKIVGAELLVPAPHIVFSSFCGLLADLSLYSAVLGTSLRALTGFAISLGLAVVFAVLSVASVKFERCFAPVVLILRATPTMSVILLALIWLNSFLSPVFVGILITFPVLYSALTAGINSIDRGLSDMSKVYKVSLSKRIKYLYFPCVLPSFSDIATSSSSLNVKVVIAGEVLAQTTGSIGIFMQISKVYIDTPRLLAWTVAAIVLSYFFEQMTRLFFSLLKKVVLK